MIIIILLFQIGYSALPGIGFLLLTMPVQTVIMKRLFMFRKKAMVWTDKRVKLLQEVLSGMRIVKFMAWELPFLEKIRSIRRLEVTYIRRLLWARSGMMAFAMSVPVIAAILAFLTYSLTKNDLEAATVFATITLFQLMRMPLMIWPIALSSTADAINALQRLSKVFEAETISNQRTTDLTLAEAIRIENASFTWDAAPVNTDAKAQKAAGKEEKLLAKSARKTAAKREPGTGPAKQAMAEVAAKTDQGDVDVTKGTKPEIPPVDGDQTPRKTFEEQIFKVKDVSLSIPRGSLTAIVGAIGSGKSSLLQGMMGEMRRTHGSVTFGGSTALCAQSPWIQNATVREVSDIELVVYIC